MKDLMIKVNTMGAVILEVMKLGIKEVEVVDTITILTFHILLMEVTVLLDPSPYQVLLLDQEATKTKQIQVREYVL